MADDDVPISGGIRDKLIEQKQQWARDGRLLTGTTSDPARERLPPGQRLGRPSNLSNSAGKHELIGSVLVGDDQVERFVVQHRLQCFQRCPHGQHGSAIRTALGHEPAPQP